MQMYTKYIFQGNCILFLSLNKIFKIKIKIKSFIEIQITMKYFFDLMSILFFKVNKCERLTILDKEIFFPKKILPNQSSNRSFGSPSRIIMPYDNNNNIFFVIRCDNIRYLCMKDDRV